MNTYRTLNGLTEGLYKEKGSKFIAYAVPCYSEEEAKEYLNAWRKEHHQARHVCYAYRFGSDKKVFRTNDDGEPNNSAGVPILGQIQSVDLTNVLVGVVRYFGGTLLGVPGLINAYKTVTSLALQTTPIIQKQIEVNYQLHFDYTRMNDVMMIVKQYNCTVVKQETNLFCDVEISIPKNRLEEVLFKLGEMHTVEVRKL